MSETESFDISFGWNWILVLVTVLVQVGQRCFC